MGKALAVYRVYPEEGADVDQVIEELKKIEKVKAIEKEPIAFGLVAIKVGLLLDDKQDDPEEWEKKVRQAKGVGEVESLEVSLIS